MMTTSDLAKQLPTMRGFRAMGAVSYELIEESEHELGLVFSDEYRAYLLAHGAACIYAHELTGICPSKRLNVVSVTEDQREFSGPVPADWYVVEELNVDDLVVWQNAAGDIFLTQPGTRPRLIAPSLLAYLSKSQESSTPPSQCSR